MAIIIEENKKNINWFALAIILAILILVGASVFYLFFVNPAIIETVIPDNLKTIKKASEMINSTDIFSSQNLSNLKVWVPSIQPEQTFNANPFGK